MQVVDGNGNIQINGSGNTINPNKKAISLEKIYVILRDNGIDSKIFIGCVFLAMASLM